jgi:hypothetical protein
VSIIFINPYRFGSAAYDADAQAYITAVETTDGQELETGVRDAINAFVVGCKADGIWTAIKACCILAGARTRLGALTPLVGAAPTPFNYTDPNYDRKTGLLGASNRYIDSNRANNADPQNDNHASIYILSRAISGAYLYANGGSTGGNTIGTQSSPNECYFRCRSITRISKGTNSTTGFLGFSRNSSANFTARNASSDSNSAIASQTTSAGNTFISYGSTARFAFYSIGESLTLALLDARVTTLINNFATAIP